MDELSALALAVAFGAGVISFLSPCVLPLVPGYISYVAGDGLAHETGMRSLQAQRLASAALSACFVAGFSTVFITLGAGAAAAGQWMLRFKNEATIAGGILVIAFGLFTVGLLKVSVLQRDLRIHAALKGSRPAVAYLMGLAFAFGWTPCIGPILGAILTVAAAAESLTRGVVLLAAYSLGLGIPFVLTAIFTAELLKRLRFARRAGRWLQYGSGVAMVLVGVAMITGLLNDVGSWLLRTVPQLGTLG
jgi:cytochrome c-type biogenesis protein